MNICLRLLSIVCIASCLPVPAFAVPFTGTFNAPITHEDDVYTGVSFINTNGTITVANGASPNDLNLSFSFGSVSASVPLVINASGGLATLAPGAHTVGTATVRDTLLFSDGNNMALAYVADDPVSGTLSYVVSAWQQSPSLADPATAIGKWNFASIHGSPNLGGGSRFGGEKNGWFNVENVGGGYAIVVNEVSLFVPLEDTPGNFSLASAPVPAGTGEWHSLHWTFDEFGKGAIVFIGVELDDPTDVGITLGLMEKAVPEPETRSMMLFALGLMAFLIQRRNGH